MQHILVYLIREYEHLKTYYDPLYGVIELEDIVLDVVKRCPELIRLKYIGMMNFRSIEMLPLTTISRLEHTIGLAYLAQLFAATNKLPTNDMNELLIASLYHDINCGAFGHSVEWAIDRYTPYNHESDSEWMSSDDSHPFFNKLPRFIEMPGLQRYKFNNSFSPNFHKIHKIIKGEDNFIINNNGIDLDNIDNVFRMAIYMGIAPKDKSIPIKLVHNLMIKDNIDNFITNSEGFEYIKIWQNLRAEVYRKFIYSREYMGFEYLIFYLISEYTKRFKEEDAINLFHFVDEKLLWFMYEKKKDTEVSRIAQRILTHDLPHAYSIVRTDDYNKKDILSKKETIDNITARVTRRLIENKLISDSLNLKVYLHVTTDNRKTNRNVEIYIEDNGHLVKQSLAKDKKYVVIGVLGNKQISTHLASQITDITMEILEQDKLGTYERVEFNETTDKAQESLF